MRCHATHRHTDSYFTLPRVAPAVAAALHESSPIAVGVVDSPLGSVRCLLCQERLGRFRAEIIVSAAVSAAVSASVSAAVSAE